jgi:uncharacterized repeat protein (TIGR03803 family)
VAKAYFSRQDGAHGGDTPCHGGNETPPQAKNAFMKTKNLFDLPALIAALNLLPVGQSPAQTFTSLGDFHDSPIFLGNALYASLHGLALSGNTYYGTWPGDDKTGDSGMVYAVNTDGTGSRSVHSFSYVVAPGYGPRINADGARPYAGLILSGATLYGTAYIGGSWGLGTVFAVKTNGTGFAVLHHFTGGSDGANPTAALILSGNTLYGTTTYGTLFALNTNGTGFRVVTNRGNYARLIVSGNTFYGTTQLGGSSSNGSVFAFHTDGTGFTNLHSFTARSGSYPYANSDGSQPNSGLILSGNILYGTAQYGGSSGSGSVFAVNTNGTGFTNLHSFTATQTNSSGIYTNSEGAHPYAGLILSGSTLYGTTFGGGSSGSGTMFSLSLPLPHLTILRSGANLVVTWPTNVAGFDSTGYTLQSAASLVPPAVWSTNSAAPVVIAGRNTVTNPITGAKQFYRLAR